MTESSLEPLLAVGRYLVFDEIASGGMGAVHIGRMLGPVGFSRTVAIKRLHPNLAKESEFVKAFVDEARVASRILHPNVITTIDVLANGGEVFLVMDFVLGEVLSSLWRAVTEARGRVPLPITLGVMSQVLQGLHAAHEAKDEGGSDLGIVHRDVSPQNVMVGVDGIARVLDFGVAKANGRLQSTDDGKVKGKFGYMPPEHLLGEKLTRTADVYSASVVLWELLTGHRLFEGADKTQTMFLVAQGAVRRPSKVVSDVPSELEEIVMRGLARDPSRRFPTAKEMALALERVQRAGTPMEIAEWLASLRLASLERRRELVTRVESATQTEGSLEGVGSVVAHVVTSPAPSGPAATEVMEAPAVPERARWGARLALSASLALVFVGIASVVVLRRSVAASEPVSAPAPEAGVTIAADVAVVASASAPPSTPAASATASAPVSAQPTRSATRGNPTAPPTVKPHQTKPHNGGDGLFERN